MIITVLFLAIGLLPIVSMLAGSLSVGGRFTFEAYRGVLASRHQWTLMGHSVLLSSLVTLLTIAAGVPLGILLGKTDLRFRKPFTVLFVVPLLIPPYITAVSWFDLLGRQGLATPLLGASTAGGAADLLFGLPGCVLVLSTAFLPIPMVLTMVFSRAIDPALEEAGRLVSPWRGVLQGVTMPLILPGVLLSAMLVFLLTFGELSVPGFLRYDVFPLESFTQFSAFYDFKAATAAALPLAAVTFAALLAERLFLRERTYQLRPAPDGQRRPVIALGRWQGWLTALVALLATVIVVLPMIVLVLQSGGIGSYAEALARAGDSLVRSLAYAAIGATLLTLLGLFIGYLIHTRALRFWRSVDSVTIFLFALPGTVIGIGLISLWNTPWTNLIYGTPMIIILGYLAKYTALTSRICLAQLEQIPLSMEEAAQVAGAGWLRTMTRIVIPLARRGLLAGWLVGYIFSLRDNGITMLVYPAGHETLPVRILTLMANGTPELIASLCVVMIAAILLPVAIVSLLPSFQAGWDRS